MSVLLEVRREDTEKPFLPPEHTLYTEAQVTTITKMHIFIRGINYEEINGKLALICDVDLLCGGMSY